MVFHPIDITEKSTMQNLILSVVFLVSPIRMNPRCKIFLCPYAKNRIDQIKGQFCSLFTSVCL